MRLFSNTAAAAILWVLGALTLPTATEAILQTAALDVSLNNGSKTYTLLVSQASFGSYPRMTPEKNEPQGLLLPPADNLLLCQNVTSSHQKGNGGGLMLVGRGECTFEQKALNAQRLGATAVAVYGTLASRYSLNTTNRTADHEYTLEDIVYPQNLYAYDCSNGRAVLDASAIQMTPLPYNAPHNDPLLSGPSSLCLKNAPDQLESCPSKACLLTGETLEKGNKIEACCAWDKAVWLYNDPTFQDNEVTIPAVYLTLGEAQELFADMQSNNNVQVTLYARYRPYYNPSAPLIWFLGVVVAAIAAYSSASEYRSATKQIASHASQTAAASDETGSHSSRVRAPPLPTFTPTAQQPMEETLELSAGHALGFIVMASSGLFILFFFKIYSVVKVMYALGCSRAITQVIFYPLVSAIARRLAVKNPIIWRTNTEDFGDITLYDIFAGCLGFGLGLVWLIIAFTVRHPESMTFFWIMQDIMGACMCILFLSIIKLNSIHVASILLIVAFFYDIFFVFVTPYLFKGESIMITVATSGGPPKADPSWCEKYPDDANCQGGDPLPMLLTVPRIGDYQGGASMLGLGDIVLPGLLLSFAARLDAAKELLGVMRGGNGNLHSSTCPQRRCMGGLGCCNGGYFAPLVVAYAIGLLMANAAVYIMNYGQPALLYLVPCCLGTMVFMGWRRNELHGLWHGPKAIRTADAIIYGEMEADPGHTPLPTEDGIETPAAPSAQDGDGGAPLLT